MKNINRIALTLSFIISTQSLLAIPADYPATAFQLAQIHHYVLNKKAVETGLITDRQGKIELLREAHKAKALFQPGVTVNGIAPAQFLIDAETLLKSHIQNPAEATESEWSSFIDALMPVITRDGENSTLSESFLLPGVKPFIIRAILEEQNAMKRGEVILWRASGKTGEKDRRNTIFHRESNQEFGYNEDDVPNYQSFSHGLFSGFLFDGHTNHYSSSYTALSACTYTYLSAFLYHKVLAKNGADGFYGTLKTKFPAFFLKYPKTLNTKITNIGEGIDYLNVIAKFYDQEDITNIINNKFHNQAALIWNLFGGYREVPEFHLYGVTMTKEQLEKESRAAEAAGTQEAFDSAEQRGEFFKAEHAVYGAGEIFHPKLVFPQNGEIISLHDYGVLFDEDDYDDDYYEDRFGYGYDHEDNNDADLDDKVDTLQDDSLAVSSTHTTHDNSEADLKRFVIPLDSIDDEANYDDDGEFIGRGTYLSAEQINQYRKVLSLS